MDAEFRKALRVVSSAGREAELARFLFDAGLDKLCEIVRSMDESLLKNLRVVLLERLSFLNLRREFRWHTRNGRVFTVGDIADDHLLNILRCYERGSTTDGGPFNGVWQHERFLRAEAQERGILKPGERLLPEEREKPARKNGLRIHYAAPLVYERADGTRRETIADRGACCGARAAARQGRLTRNQQAVTCGTCLRLLRNQSLVPLEDDQ